MAHYPDISHAQNNAVFPESYTSAGNAAAIRAPILHHTVETLQSAIARAEKVSALLLDSHQQHFGSVVEQMTPPNGNQNATAAPENTDDTIRRLSARLSEVLSRVESFAQQLTSRL